MRDGDFEGCNFQDAQLIQVNLDRGNIHLAVMTDANLDRAILTNVRGGPAAPNNN